MQKSNSGFTLVETLVALAIVGMVATPLSYWLYKNPMNQRVYKRYAVDNALRDQCYQLLLHKEVAKFPGTIEVHGFGPFETTVKVGITQKETCYTATAYRDQDTVSRFVGCTYE
ncbi:MAG: prepilin-type N-terminal cleavage/methylation domain-containing protein [Fibrobacterales bacterium]